jgi:hypothetical protein
VRGNPAGSSRREKMRSSGGERFGFVLDGGYVIPYVGFPRKSGRPYYRFPPFEKGLLRPEESVF